MLTETELLQLQYTAAREYLETRPQTIKLDWESLRRWERRFNHPVNNGLPIIAIEKKGVEEPAFRLYLENAAS